MFVSPSFGKALFPCLPVFLLIDSFAFSSPYFITFVYIQVIISISVC